MKVMIVGAGIGGLTTALFLNKLGYSVSVFDSVAEMKEIGVGINLQPSATKILASLELLPKLKTVSVEPTAYTYRSPDGRLIYSMKRGVYAGYSFPQLSIHRGKLQKILLQAFNQQIGNEHLFLDHEFQSFSQCDEMVNATFANNNKAIQYHADLLIGCDGIHSNVRKQLHPNQSDFSFEGIMMWRGTTNRKPLSTRPMVTVFGTPYVQLVTYPITNPNDNGEVLLNWVLEINTNNRTISEVNWGKRGKLSDFKHYFRNWKLEFLDDLFEKANVILEYPMVDKEPLSHWGDGRVTLLGDAAHPMYPRGANGATQTIIDAEMLSQCLRQNENPISALREYEAQRLSKTSQIVLSNRQAVQTAIFRAVAENCNPACTGSAHNCIDQAKLNTIADQYLAKTN